MIKNLVVTTFKDKSVLKGETSDFLPNKSSFHLTLDSGEIQEINVEDLKAIFFVKNLDGDKDHDYAYSDSIPGGGKKLRVKFQDGEVVVGYSQGYTPDRPGFFVVPADRGGNNLRIFVVRSATETVDVE